MEFNYYVNYVVRCCFSTHDVWIKFHGW